MKSTAALLFATIVVVSLILAFKPHLFDRPKKVVSVERVIAENCPQEHNRAGRRVVICNNGECRCGTYEEYEKAFGQ